MKNRLRRREREAVRSKYAATECLYRMMGKGARELEKQMGHFRLAAEEVFLEVMTMADRVKEDPGAAIGEYDGWWNTLYCDYRDMDTADSPDEELRLATSETVYMGMLLMGMCRGRVYSNLASAFMAQLTENHPESIDRLTCLFMPDVWKTGEERLKARMQDYMENNEWISDEIRDLLENLPVEGQPPLPDTGKEPAKGDSQFTNRQLIILFESLMDLSLSSQYTNIKALARVISKVSGRSEGSIRTCINSGIDYDNPSVKNDVEVVAGQLDVLDAKLAGRLRNNVE